MSALMVERMGQGSDLALIHGWGIGKSAWQTVLPLLTQRFRVHLVELPGYGSFPDKAPVADFMETAAALADSLPAGCTLCGWSLGGLLAMQAACFEPRRVGRLILCGATPSFIQRADWPHAQPPALLNSFSEAVTDNAAGTLQRFSALLNQGDVRARANVRTLARALTANPLPDSATLLRGLHWLGSVDLRAQIAEITLPTLIIHGENDPLMPLAAAHWLNENLPHAQLKIFSGAAHAPFLNNPERFVQLFI